MLLGTIQMSMEIERMDKITRAMFTKVYWPPMVNISHPKKERMKFE
jgi:hypothetical protein